MTKAVTRTWYRIALARAGAPTQLVAASGEHMGQAIAEARDHVAGSWPVAVEHAQGQDIPLGESVGKGHVLMLGDAPADTPTFEWPTGVLPSLAAPGSAFAGAAPGWVMRPESKLLVIEAQTTDDKLTDLFLGMVERLPAGDNLEVRVLDHFEDAGTTDVWLTSRVTAKKIIRFIDDHDTELIGNGHLELSIYVRAQNATLRLSEHKTVLWLAEGRALEVEACGWLKDLGVPPAESLVTVREGAHFHYRPAKSRDRKKLGEELYRQRMRKVDSVATHRA
ncbi:MAG TPA: hypothetical protein VMZ53_04540 [Kofleriaceae bacterium]|nr:hypothetical protein [Kofleriaceae bacterium]